ncbi:hypothetical protein ABU614_04710 [Lysobacter firmicutimachus]|uniref:Uncharacterized protein n=1 Tax=Lysobacter firmicutimachus TaxID=1792846 RepID=A0AAU8MWV3_9GAMM
MNPRDPGHGTRNGIAANRAHSGNARMAAPADAAARMRGAETARSGQGRWKTRRRERGIARRRVRTASGTIATP